MQCGFRKQSSTNDHLVRIESFVREAFAQRQHAVGVFFDMEKAHESTWKFGIMRDLHDAGLRGRLPLFIESFLKNRHYLSGLKINSIVKTISPGVECSLYVDDFLICYRSKHIHIIERHQQCLSKLSDWADTNGFKFSPSKTVCIHFCKLRKLYPDPVLLLGTVHPFLS